MPVCVYRNYDQIFVGLCRNDYDKVWSSLYAHSLNVLSRLHYLACARLFLFSLYLLRTPSNTTEIIERSLCQRALGFWVYSCAFGGFAFDVRVVAIASVAAVCFW